MNKQRGHPLRILLCGLLFLVGFFFFGNTAEAGVRTIPSSAEPAAWAAIKGGSTGVLITDYDKATVKQYTNGHAINYTQDGKDRHSIWINTTENAGSKSDIATFRFSNAGYVFGNPIDVVMNVAEVRYTAADNCSCSAARKKRLLFMNLERPIHVGFTTKGANDARDDYFCQHRRYRTTLDFTVYYAGTNTLVPASTPFYQTFYDIDAGDDYYRESATGTTGYTGDLFVFSRYKMSISASAGKVSLKMDASERGGRAMNNHETYAVANVAANGATHSCSNNVHDWDSTINGGGVATIRGNHFSMTFESGGCSSAVQVYSPTSSIGSPSKSVDNTKGYYDGDACDWTITQPIGTYYANMYQPYASLTFTDTMDPNLTVTGVSVYKGSASAANQLGTGNYSYSLSGQRVTVSMASGYLNNTGIYDGKPIICVIHTKVKANGLTKSTIPNTGTVTMEGTAKNTNTVAIRPLYRVYATHEGQGTTNPAAIKDGIEWNASSKVTYTPAKDWYTKEVYYGSQKGYADSGKDGLTHKGGSDLKANSLLTEYTFTGINEDKHLHAVFIPIPELTVQKAISGDRKGYSPFGSPLFHYKIQGTDYLGDTHTWYWNIQNEGRVTRKVPAGEYTVTEMPISRYSLQNVENIKNFTNLSVPNRNGLCNLKNGLPTDTPGSSAGDGHIRFKNQLLDWEDYGHNSQIENKVK